MFYPIVFIILVAKATGNLFDEDLHESVLDDEFCEQQIKLILNSSLNLMFLDASGGVPTGVSSGNVYDLGDYDQCVGINTRKHGQDIGGKYCLVDVSLRELDHNTTSAHSIDFINVWKLLEDYDVNLTLGLCIPKVCTLKESMDLFPAELTTLGVTQRYCRIRNDKPWLVVDYLALAIFSLIGLLNLVSTSYDLHQKFAEKKHAAKPSGLLRAFSVYTNTRQLLALSPRPGALGCVDGLRALSMLWVILAHTFIFSILSPTHNANYIDYFVDHRIVLLSSASFAVDTFTALAGIFCVYCTLTKYTRTSFTKSIHLFYLNRLLRMFPLLAAVVLLHASIINHASDGPLWGNMELLVLPCRAYWWSALLHVQNWFNGNAYCIPQSWYLSADVQLYVLSPLALVFLFGPRRRAGLALALMLGLALLFSSIYNFYDLIFMNGVSSSGEWKIDLTILERLPIFCVGLVYGYLLYQVKGKTVKINQFVVVLLWILVAVSMIAIPLTTAKEAHVRAFEKEWYDHFVNAFMRSLWGVSIGWIIFACVHGYGGPVNWFLSLKVWKLLSRLSYAMYLTHNMVSAVYNTSWYNSRYLSVGGEIHQYLADLSITLMISFVMCLLIDAPTVALKKILIEEIWGKSTTADSSMKTVSVIENDRKENTTSL